MHVTNNPIALSPQDWLKQQREKANSAKPKPPACDVTTAQAAEVEAWLQKHSVQYGPLTEIPLSAIDVAKSRANQARPEPLVSESVERFTTALKKGESFPPIVVFPQGQRLVIVDGNNREASARKAGQATIYGYILSEDTPSEVIQLLTVSANAAHGVTPDLRWRVRQALGLVALGYSIEAAAEAAAVTPAQLSTAKTLQQVDARARSLKISGFGDMPQSVRVKLAVLKQDPIFIQASRVAIDTQMIVEEVVNFIRGIKATHSDADAFAYIAGVSAQRGIEAATRKAMGKVRMGSAKTNLTTALGKLMHVDPGALARSLLTDIERAETARRLAQGADKLLELQIAVEAMMEETANAS